MPDPTVPKPTPYPTPKMMEAGKQAVWDHLHGGNQEAVTPTLWPLGCETLAMVAWRAMEAARD